MHNSQQSVCSFCAEAILRPIIKYWIVELMDDGGTYPEATRDCVADEEPDLCKAVGHKRVLELCQELHRSEDLTQSKRFTTRLHQFDKRYFDGRLRDYRVRVVYDVMEFWVGEPLDDFVREHTDLAGHQIFLPVTQIGDSNMDCMLLHHMAHAATNTSMDDAPEWLLEMDRLRSLGAPVEYRLGCQCEEATKAVRG